MINIVLETLFFSTLLITLITLSSFDYTKSIIPNQTVIVLIGLALIHYFSNLNENWYLPLVSSLGLFVLFFIIFLITGESLIGGGDMKLVCVSLLMLNSFNLIYYYVLWSCLFTFIGALMVKIKGERSVRCGPFYSLALIFTVFPFDIMTLVTIMVLFLLSMLIIKIFYFRKEWFCERKIEEVF